MKRKQKRLASAGQLGARGRRREMVFIGVVFSATGGGDGVNLTYSQIQPSLSGFIVANCNVMTMFREYLTATTDVTSALNARSCHIAPRPVSSHRALFSHIRSQPVLSIMFLSPNCRPLSTNTSFLFTIFPDYYFHKIIIMLGTETPHVVYHSTSDFPLTLFCMGWLTFCNFNLTKYKFWYSLNSPCRIKYYSIRVLFIGILFYLPVI